MNYRFLNSIFNYRHLKIYILRSISLNKNQIVLSCKICRVYIAKKSQESASSRRNSRKQIDKINSISGFSSHRLKDNFYSSNANDEERWSSISK